MCNGLSHLTLAGVCAVTTNTRVLPVLDGLSHAVATAESFGGVIQGGYLFQCVSCVRQCFTLGNILRIMMMSETV